MIIKILQDNTVVVRYPGGANQTLNSACSHKAASPVVKVICDAFPYKGAMEFTEGYEAPVFMFDRCEDCPDSLKDAMGDYYTELCSLKAKLDAEEDRQATETVTVEEEVIDIVDGKAVQSTKQVTKEVPVYDELPCVDANGDQICDICNEKHVEFPIVQPKTVKVPRMVKGKKVSDADKARLAELLGQP